MIVIIPAYQPDAKLVNLVRRLKRETDYDILIVDDGSDERCRAVFSEVSAHAVVLRHEVNRGKGAALKTAYAYAKTAYAEDEGLVTVDADGQHLPQDIVRVSEAWQSQPDALVLGSRRFTGDVPFKSRAGNAITRVVFAVSTGVRVFDTQTGLRAFSVRRIPEMLGLSGDRYEYEINVLLYATKHAVPIVEVPIETVYINENASSHFHAVSDAWRIYKMILLFVASSLTCAVLDYVLLIVLSAATSGMRFSLLISVVGARLISSFVNFCINHNYVFRSGGVKGSVWRYYSMAAILLAVNYGLMELMILIMPIAAAKIVVELLIYPLSFLLQRWYVFIEKRGKEER